MQRRVLLIGLDAADLDVMRPLIARGDLPHIGGLMARGASGVLHSTVPPVSAPAWASFLTGRQPGGHGLYSFVVERGDAGETHLANIGDIQGPKIWDAVVAQGRRPVVANVPVTWPPPAFDGVLVTGMLTPESREVQWTHPPELQERIASVVPGYRIDIDRAILDDGESVYGAMADMTRRRRDLFVHLAKNEAWDLLVTVFTNTDRIQHSLWRSGRERVDEFFGLVDGCVGDVLAAAADENTLVMLMSDHGFQDATHKVYLNRFLQERGLLATRTGARGDDPYARRRPDYFEDFQGGGGAAVTGTVSKILAKVGIGREVVMDWSRTRAFTWSLDTAGVGVNLASRYPYGCVSDSDYESVRDEIIAALTALELPGGRSAFRTVRRREDVYSGPHADKAPDVVTEPADGVEFGIALDRREVIREHKRPAGQHSPRGFVALAGPGVRAGAAIEGNIVDCLPTILHGMGLAVPEGLDGRVLLDAFDDGRSVATTSALENTAVMSAPSFTAEEEAALRESLEGLGYL